MLLQHAALSFGIKQVYLVLVLLPVLVGLRHHRVRQTGMDDAGPD